MKRELLNSKDFWAGIMLIVIGAAAVIIARGFLSFSTFSAACLNFSKISHVSHLTPLVPNFANFARGF